MHFDFCILFDSSAAAYIYNSICDTMIIYNSSSNNYVIMVYFLCGVAAEVRGIRIATQVLPAVLFGPSGSL